MSNPPDSRDDPQHVPVGEGRTAIGQTTAGLAGTPTDGHSDGQTRVLPTVPTAPDTDGRKQK